MTLGDNSQKQLQSFIERIERLEAERRELGEGLRSVYGEARDLYGFSVPAMREVIKRRRQDPAKQQAHDDLVESYQHALGMLPLEEVIERSRTADPPFMTGNEDQ